MNISQMIQKIAIQEKKEAYEVYRKYYAMLTTKYPECILAKIEGKSKIKQIEEQGFTQKLEDILNEDFPDLFKEIKYTNKQKIKIFEKELHLIGGLETENEVNDDIKKFVMRALLKVPDYFWNIPASSTGKCHPSFAVTTNGLAKHVKAAIRIALDLFNVEIFDFSQRHKGIIIASLILHDCAKNGFNNSQYTIPKHPTEITKFLYENIELEDFPEEDFSKMKSAIESHMGKWNTSNKSNKEILPKPKSKIQYFVHICDLLASRKYITFDFDKDFEV